MAILLADCVQTKSWPRMHPLALVCFVFVHVNSRLSS
jgi:hypothetical protein